jgi:hypothetical protein
MAARPLAAPGMTGISLADTWGARILMMCDWYAGLLR